MKGQSLVINHMYIYHTYSSILTLFYRLLSGGAVSGRSCLGQDQPVSR